MTGTTGKRRPLPFERAFGYFFADAASAGSENAAWFPLVDIYETAEHFVLSAEVPGVQSEDLRIGVRGRELSIQGERKHDEACRGETYHRIEGPRGRFHRVFTLPDSLDSESIHANLRDGVLQVILPKASGPKRRR